VATSAAGMTSAAVLATVRGYGGGREDSGDVVRRVFRWIKAVLTSSATTDRRLNIVN